MHGSPKTSVAAIVFASRRTEFTLCGDFVLGQFELQDVQRVMVCGTEPRAIRLHINELRSQKQRGAH